MQNRRGVVYPVPSPVQPVFTRSNPYTNPSSHHIQTMAQVCPSLGIQSRAGAQLIGGITSKLHGALMAHLLANNS